MRNFRTLLQIRRSSKRKIQGVPHGSIFPHAKNGKKVAQKRRRGFPESGQWTVIPGLKIHVEHSLIPAAGTYRMFRIIADRVDHGLHETDAKRLRVLRHKDDMTQMVAPDFADKFRKTRGLCQVQRAAGLASVAV